MVEGEARPHITIPLLQQPPTGLMRPRLKGIPFVHLEGKIVARPEWTGTSSTFHIVRPSVTPCDDRPTD
jgi:hypothetical protein